MKCVSLATDLVSSDLKEVLGSPDFKQNSAKIFIEKYAKASEKRMEDSKNYLKRRNRTSAAVSTRKIVEERVATLGLLNTRERKHWKLLSLQTPSTALTTPGSSTSFQRR